MPRRLYVRRLDPRLKLTPEAARRNGWTVLVACVRCQWFSEPRFGPQHAALMDQDFETLWRKPGFRCSRCGRHPKALRITRPRARSVLLQIEAPGEMHG